MRPAAKWAAECIALSSRTYHPDRGATGAERKARFDAKRRAERALSLEHLGAKPPGGRQEADAQAALPIQFDDWGRSWRVDDETSFRPRRVGIVAQRQRERLYAEDMGEPLTAWERQVIGVDDSRRRRPSKPKNDKTVPAAEPFMRKTKTEASDYSPEGNLEWALNFMRDYEARRRQ